MKRHHCRVSQWHSEKISLWVQLNWAWTHSWCVYITWNLTHTHRHPPRPPHGGWRLPPVSESIPRGQAGRRRGQESGLISACHQRRLSLHTHSGRAVHRGSEKKAVNLAPAHTPDVTLMCPEFPPSTLSALLVRSGEKRRKGRDKKKKGWKF